MYTRDIYKTIRHIIPETVASTATSTDYKSNLLNSTTVCNITGSTTRSFGRNFSVTIEATTGAIYILPEVDAEPTSTCAFKIPEGGLLDLKIKDLASIKGDSTTAKFQAIVWSDV